MLVSDDDNIKFQNKSTPHISPSQRVESSPWRTPADCHAPIRLPPVVCMGVWCLFFINLVSGCGFSCSPRWAPCVHSLGPERGHKPLVIFLFLHQPGSLPLSLPLATHVFDTPTPNTCTHTHTQPPHPQSPCVVSFIRLNSALGSFWASCRFACAF